MQVVGSTGRKGCGLRYSENLRKMSPAGSGIVMGSLGPTRGGLCVMESPPHPTPGVLLVFSLEDWKPQ